MDMADTLQDVSRWTLTTGRWNLVSQRLVALADAIGRASEDDVTKALVDLELAGPVRIRTRLGDEPLVPAPLEVRERLNRLVFELGAPPPADRADPATGDG
jgi:hypothetical protein